MDAGEFADLTNWMGCALEDGLILDKREDRGVSITAFSPAVLDLMGLVLERDWAVNLFFQDPEWAWIKGFHRYNLEEGKGVFLFPSAPLRSQRLEVDLALYLPLGEQVVRAQDWGPISQRGKLNIVRMELNNKTGQERLALRSPKVLAISNLYRRLGGADLPLLFVDHALMQK